VVSLNADRVPEALRLLVPLAEKWGISDDVARAARVSEAHPGELAPLVGAVDSVEESDLYGWLAGEESYSHDPSDEYVAITCLTMAADAARLRLRDEAK
jgi:hypothetical protein